MTDEVIELAQAISNVSTRVERLEAVQAAHDKEIDTIKDGVKSLAFEMRLLRYAVWGILALQVMESHRVSGFATAIRELLMKLLFL